VVPLSNEADGTVSPRGILAMTNRPVALNSGCRLEILIPHDTTRKSDITALRAVVVVDPARNVLLLKECMEEVGSPPLIVN